MKAVSTLFRIFYLFLAVAYIIRFVIRIFEPGNAENQAFMQVARMVVPYMDAVLNALKLPVDLVLNLLTSILPATAKAWFPLTPAGELMTKLSEILLMIPKLDGTPVGQAMVNADYRYLFPGALDWSLLLAVTFWGIVEAQADGFIARREARARWQRRQQIEEAMDADIRRTTRDR